MAQAYARPEASSLLLALWASPTPATLQGPDQRLLDANLAFSALVGCAREALIGRSAFEFEPAEDQLLARGRPASSQESSAVPAPNSTRPMTSSGRAVSPR